MIVLCPSCKRELSLHAKQCPGCGRALRREELIVLKTGGEQETVPARAWTGYVRPVPARKKKKLLPTLSAYAGILLVLFCAYCAIRYVVARMPEESIAPTPAPMSEADRELERLYKDVLGEDSPSVPAAVEERFGKVDFGMSYDTVRELVGEADEHTIHVVLNGAAVDMYTWRVGDQQSVTVVFRDDQVAKIPVYRIATDVVG